MTRIELGDHDVVGLRADNPGPLTLTGTNSWVIGREPAWLIDPGPALDAHVDALARELAARGGLGGIALTHGHPDHADAAPALLQRFPGAVRGPGPLEELALSGHSPEHVVFLHGPVAFTGDAVLGQGSVFIAADPGALRGYLDGLAQLRARGPEILAPGHGPLVRDPQARIDGLLAHRLKREQRLLAALAQGARSVEALLGAAWSEVPPALMGAAAITLGAHLDKLEEDGRLPAGVQRPPWPPPGWPSLAP